MTTRLEKSSREQLVLKATLSGVLFLLGATGIWGGDKLEDKNRAAYQVQLSECEKKGSPEVVYECRDAAENGQEFEQGQTIKAVGIVIVLFAVGNLGLMGNDTLRRRREELPVGEPGS